ncbi:bifunctional tRNA (mnm(5)s(2)U34)-methyltransferase/FAD-dependent cmnm(5)s(2)U34 oxidoreductase [Catenovulum agarivorans DS-2]|uniref:tRNA 5-methylaminomethyl-2-thiouridine biosynthesis bifunctional protein MnmC n=1 Tax=Catenovulum agarivorans DS-2 TaxID=1328313 RepID=W7QDK7_9ALTE|nr:FAD-dependent 5-carboxymethylaminomethyl-2-thiouridine(34) oxidoreductase MnmC [Catenovulum agarivorans]EWH10001.1 bifunctional tRNA (mnm(5)s(2)U34)-methyltransferase/FAD-dependent cmnm(5)s(2)U34 oxidoreductase [Catenovulum agarivorans DS-2]
MTKITTAQIEFRENGTPVSQSFDDIYFSREDGLTESIEVFQQGNRLLTRWQACEKSVFTIAETGFGTGLNFLAVCQSFSQFIQQNPTHKLKRLHFISFEKYPLEKQSLRQALANWPSLAQWSEPLLNQYPYLVAGPHRLQLSANIQLDLWIGDVQDSLQQMQTTKLYQVVKPPYFGEQVSRKPIGQGFVDAWFLDGFAPSKNPDMWQQGLFEHMARLSSAHGSFSTFTAAGFVRRGLIAAGFKVDKVAGFGRKRERIQGYLNQTSAKPAPAKTSNIAVIGGGIAAICTAMQLLKRDLTVDLYYQQPASGASGNQQGAIYPLLQNDHNNLIEVYLKGFYYAKQFYQNCLNLFDFPLEWCGVAQLNFSKLIAERQQAITSNPYFPAELVKAVDKQTLSKLSGIQLDTGGMYYPDGGWISPKHFVEGALDYLHKQTHVNIWPQHQLVELTYQGDNRSWQLDFQLDNNAKIRKNYDKVVLATGHQLAQFNACEHVAIEALRGQVSHLTATTEMANLKTVLCHKGYITPNWLGEYCIGATFSRDLDLTSNVKVDNHTNVVQQQKFLPNQADNFSVQRIVGQRAAIRAASLDHIPIMGEVLSTAELKYYHAKKNRQRPPELTPQQQYSGLYLLSGLGSRGLTTAPLLAETLAATIANEGLPLSHKVFEALNPNRFFYRGIKRGLV